MPQVQFRVPEFTFSSLGERPYALVRAWLNNLIKGLHTSNLVTITEKNHQFEIILYKIMSRRIDLVKELDRAQLAHHSKNTFLLPLPGSVCGGIQTDFKMSTAS